MKAFKNLFPSYFVSDFAKENGFTAPTKIQSLAAKPVGEGRHTSIISQTGSGKTLSYLFPLIEKLKEKEADSNEKEIYVAPRIIIVAPTKELADQINSVSRSFAHHAKYRSRLYLKGGRIETLGQVDLLVTVPGKLASLFKSNKFNRSRLTTIVFDEADQLLDKTFEKEILSVTKDLDESVQIILATATVPSFYNEMINRYFEDIEFFSARPKDADKLVPTIKSFNINLSYKEKNLFLAKFIKKEAKGKGIVFFNKASEMLSVKDEIAELFPKTPIFLLHGDIQPKARSQVLKKFRTAHGAILLASDVAARGIDMLDLMWVLNYDLPFEAIYYIHRAGRVGRGGKSGIVYNFVTPKDSVIIKRINEAIRKQTALKLMVVKENASVISKKAQVHKKNQTKRPPRQNYGKVNSRKTRGTVKAALKSTKKTKSGGKR